MNRILNTYIGYNGFIIDLIHQYHARKLRVRVPLRSIHFLSLNLRYFHKKLPSWGENKCCCPRTVNISNVNFTTKISIQPEPVFKNMGQQMSGPASSSGLSIRHESEGSGLSHPQVDTFSVSNTSTLSQEHPFVSRKWMLLPAKKTINISNVNFTTIYIWFVFEMPHLGTP